MPKKSCIVIIALLAAVSAACDDDASTSPTPDSVVIYADTNFRGNNRVVLGNIADFDDLPGCGGAGADWDDCISSIRIPSGWEITVFEHDNFTGTSAIFTADVTDLEQRQGPCGNDWDDCISSMQVRQR